MHGSIFAFHVPMLHLCTRVLQPISVMFLAFACRFLFSAFSTRCLVATIAPSHLAQDFMMPTTLYFLVPWANHGRLHVSSLI